MSNGSALSPSAPSVKKTLRVAPKPDLDKHSATIKALNQQIDNAKTQLNKVRDCISSLNSNSDDTTSLAGSQRENIHAKLASVKKAKVDTMRDRDDGIRRIANLQENLQQKRHELQQITSRLGYSTAQQVQERITHLERKVQGGDLKLLEEKKAINEIAQLKRSQPLIDTIAVKTQEISRDEVELASLQAKLASESPSTHSFVQAYDDVKRELDRISESKQSRYAKLSTLYQDRDQFTEQLSALHAERARAQDDFRVAKEEHYRTLREDRARKQAQFLSDKKRLELERLTELAQEERERANILAFFEEIQVCTNLIAYVKTTVGIRKSIVPGDDEVFSLEENASSSDKSTTLTNFKPHNSKSHHQVRKVEAPKEAEVLKRGGGKDESDLLFAGVGKKKTKKGVKSGHSTNGSTATGSNSVSASSTLFKLPLPVMEQFWLVKVNIPITYAEAEATIQALVERRAWYAKHSPAVTARNKALAETKIQLLLAGDHYDTIRSSCVEETTTSNDYAEAEDTDIQVGKAESESMGLESYNQQPEPEGNGPITTTENMDIEQ